LFEETGLKDELKDDVKEEFLEIIKSEVILELVKSVIPFSHLVSSIGKGFKAIAFYKKKEHDLKKSIEYY
jgi:hypothetical protein